MHLFLNRYLDKYYADTVVAKKYAKKSLVRKEIPVVISENPILCFNMIWRFADDYMKIREMFLKYGDTGNYYNFSFLLPRRISCANVQKINIYFFYYKLRKVTSRTTS